MKNRRKGYLMKKQKADIDIMKEISKKAQYFNNGGVEDNYDVKP